MKEISRLSRISPLDKTSCRYKRPTMRCWSRCGPVDPLQQTIPIYPIHAQYFLTNLCALHAYPTSFQPGFLTSGHAFNNKTARATRTLFAVIGHKCANEAVSISRSRDLCCPHHSPEPRRPCYVILTDRAEHLTRVTTTYFHNILSLVFICNQANINSTGIYYNLWTRPAAGGKVFVTSVVIVILQATLKKKRKEYEGTIIHEEKKVSITGLFAAVAFDRGCTEKPIRWENFDAKRLDGWTKQTLVCMWCTQTQGPLYYKCIFKKISEMGMLRWAFRS